MTDKSYTHAVLLIDKSGSMAENEKAIKAQQSIDQFMLDQAEGDGRITVSLYEFDASHGNVWHGTYTVNNLMNAWSAKPAHKKVFGPIDVREAPQYHIYPSGGTALRDAMSAVIDETGAWLRSLKEDQRPETVIFVTITDGEENSSRLVTDGQLKEKVLEQTNKYNWQFVFFGANIDAFEVGQSYGITTNVQYRDTGASYAGAYNTFSSALLSSRATGQSIASTYTTRNFDDEGNAI